MKILMTAFAGERNSSRILIESLCIAEINTLILKNDFSLCADQLVSAVSNQLPDTILSFGQKPHSNRLYIETQAKSDREILKTSYDISMIEESLASNKIKYKLSNDAGNYLCNHIYFTGLKYIKTNGLKTKMLFIHTPDMKNFAEFDKVLLWLETNLKSFIRRPEYAKPV